MDFKQAIVVAEVALLTEKIQANSEKAPTANKAKEFPTFDLGNGPT
jgi:hypothetical protein